MADLPYELELLLAEAEAMVTVARRRHQQSTNYARHCRCGSFLGDCDGLALARMVSRLRELVEAAHARAIDGAMLEMARVWDQADDAIERFAEIAEIGKEPDEWERISIHTDDEGRRGD